MKDEVSRPTLRSYLADSGVPPEKFLEALALLNEEIKALLEDVRPAPAAVPPPAPASENDSIRGILEEIKTRWIRQDRAKTRADAPAPAASAAPPAPPATPPAPERAPAAPQDAKRITVETLILKGPPGPRSQPRPPGPMPPAEAAQPPAPAAPTPPAAPQPADDQPTTFIRVDSPPAPVPPPPAPPAPESGEMLLETVIRTSREKPQAPRAPQGNAPPAPADDQPTTFIRVEQPAPSPEPPAPAAKPPDDDDMAKTVILRPDQLKEKGKGGRK